MVWLANTEDSAERVQEFLEGARLGLPSLLDAEEPYRRYLPEVPDGEPWAPYPLQVVIDQGGVIRYLAQTHDPPAVRAVIDRLLDEGSP